MKKIVMKVIDGWASLTESQQETYFYGEGMIGFCEEILSNHELETLTTDDGTFQKLLDTMWMLYNLD